MAIKHLEALPLAEILGSLLSSVIQAQAQSARATVDFVEEVGFESTTDGPKLRTVKIKYSKKDENGDPAEFEIEVPLLAMVNVPALSINEAKLSFSYDVVTTKSNSSEPKNSTTVRPKYALMKGFVRSQKRSPNVANDAHDRFSAAIDLDVTMGQQEIPMGVERLFDLAELGMLESKIGGNDES